MGFKILVGLADTRSCCCKQSEYGVNLQITTKCMKKWRYFKVGVCRMTINPGVLREKRKAMGFTQEELSEKG